MTYSATTDFRTVGPNLLSSPQTWGAIGGTIKIEDSTATLQATEGKPGTFKAALSVEPNAEYFFSADTLSENRVVFTLAGLNMAYHTQGKLQTVCGLVRSGPKGKLEVMVSLRSLKSGQPITAEIKNLTLQKVQRPTEIYSKPRNGDTLLTRDGKPQAVVIYPSATTDGKRQAEAIRAAVEAKSGAELSIVSDREATEEKAPILKQNFRDQNLVIIGRLATNRALWSAYTRFLAAEDGYYPGGDGFTVRTAADVFSNGHNQLILGGSTEAGVQKAVERFVELIGKAGPKKDLQIPWTLEVELGGECRAAFAADNKKWEDSDDAILPAMTSGYGKLVRWYANAMGYYWSAQPDYRARAQGYLKPLLAERANPHQYIAEFFVRTYEMLDESPFFSREEVAQLDSLIVSNFLDFLTVTDLQWMTSFAPPYTEISITNRHQIAPWFADLVMARFLDRHVELGGKLQQLVAFRLSEKEAAFHAFAATRNGPSLPGIAAPSDYEEIPASLYRYALENDLYHEFFDSGLARQALALERFDHTLGRYAEPACNVDLPMFLGALAHLTLDGRYQWLATQIPYSQSPKGPFQNRYVAGVHRYQMGADLAPVEPDPSWAGIQEVAQPELRDQTKERERSSFPLISMRGGFKPSDDFLAIVGVNPALPSGVLARLEINGQGLFGTSSEDGEGSFSRITTSGASALNLDRYSPSQPDFNGQSCVLRWKGELPGCWAMETETPISPDILWRRATIRLQNGLYAFSDTFTAQRDGRYLLRVAWHASASLNKNEKGWKIATSKATAQLNMLGQGFASRETNSSAFAESIRSLKKGESSTVWSFVQRLSPTIPDWTMALQDALQISLSQGGDTQIILHHGELKTSAGNLAADLQVMQPDSTSVFGWRQTPQGDALSFAWSRDSTSPPLPAEPWQSAVREALSHPDKSQPSQAIASPQLNIVDARDHWSPAWSYEGLLKPARILPKILTSDLVDFGREIPLAEVRSVAEKGRPSEPSALPSELFYPPGIAQAQPPSEDSAWKPLTGERKSRPGAKTGNYGEIHPVDQIDESFFPKGISTRFVKGAGAAAWKYFESDLREARHPVKVRVLRDLPGEPLPLILASSWIFPAFPRPMRDDDFSMSLLRPDGKPMAQLELPGPVESILVADQAGQGHAQILALTGDGRLDTFSLTGQPLLSKNLFEQLVAFDKSYGRPNTRHPAGGQRMPFSLGLWRKNADGASKVVVGRYGNLSFLDEKLNLEGVLVSGPYAISQAISQGLDLSGDGSDEMLLLERHNLIQVGGNAQPVVRDPDGAQFWPQVYNVEAQTAPREAETNLLAGAPVYAFEVLKKFGEDHHYVFVLRGNYLGLFDAWTKKWAFSWAPPGPIEAGAIVRETSDQIQVCLATVDGIFWSVSWDRRRLNRPAIDIQPLGWKVHDITASPLRDGSALISTAQGIFQRGKDSSFTHLVAGDFQSADYVSTSPTEPGIAAADAHGKIISFIDTSKK